ncbi:UNVERIFIED_CONTAM: hypothetical protein K2H54_066588 [Gekko kuhli]
MVPKGQTEVLAGGNTEMVTPPVTPISESNDASAYNDHGVDTKYQVFYASHFEVDGPELDADFIVEGTAVFNGGTDAIESLDEASNSINFAGGRARADSHKATFIFSCDHTRLIIHFQFTE